MMVHANQMISLGLTSQKMLLSLGVGGSGGLGFPKITDELAVKELKLSYHTGYIYIYIINSRVSEYLGLN